MLAWAPSLREAFLALAPHAAVAGPLCGAVRDGTFAGIARLDDICAAAGIAESRGKAAEAALGSGAPYGLFARCGPSEWCPGTGPFADLATALAAVTLYRDQVYVDVNRVEVVLTLPGNPSQLRDTLRRRGWVEAKLEHTEAILLHLATQAIERFAVLSPFIDAGGMRSLLTLLRATKGSVRRVVVTRCQDGVLPPPLQGARSDLASLGVAVYNYWLPRQGGYETFHAKVLIADAEAAYVGSANLTQASLGLSMELGTFLRGQSVKTLVEIMDAILSIATRVQ